jgi:hypothetical protein
LGVDLISLQNLATSKNLDRSWFSQGSNGEAAASQESGFWKLLERPTAIFCAQSLAEEEGLQVGSKWSLIMGERTVEFELAGSPPPPFALPPQFMRSVGSQQALSAPAVTTLVRPSWHVQAASKADPSQRCCEPATAQEVSGFAAHTICIATESYSGVKPPSQTQEKLPKFA